MPSLPLHARTGMAWQLSTAELMAELGRRQAGSVFASPTTPTPLPTPAPSTPAPPPPMWSPDDELRAMHITLPKVPPSSLAKVSLAKEELTIKRPKTGGVASVTTCCDTATDIFESSTVFAPDTASTVAATSVCTAPTIYGGGSMEERKAAIIAGMVAKAKGGEEEEAGAASDEDPDADGTTSSRLSSSRPKCHKGDRAKARNLLRLAAHQASRGVVFKDKKEIVARDLHAATGKHGTLGVEIQRAVVKENAANKYSKDEYRLFVQSYATGPSQWVKVRDGRPFCYLCDKWADAGNGHETSSAHCLRVEETAIGDLQCGKAQTTRRFSGGGLPGGLTQAAMMRHWGDAITHLPVAARLRHEAVGAVQWGNITLTPSMIAGYELGCVSYSGAGKYDNMKYFPYDEVPQNLDCLEGTGEEALVPPANTTWWPVTSLILKPEFTILLGGAKCIIIVCFYQWINGAIIAWTLYLEV